MSNPSPPGRGTPRWSVGREVAGSAASTAGLVAPIAIVGVLPGGLICNGPSRGSLDDTIPGHPKLFWIRLPEPTAVTPPLSKHSRAPFEAMMVLRRVKDVTSESTVRVTTMPAPSPVLSLPLTVESSTVSEPSAAKIAPPASRPLSAPVPPSRPRTTKLLVKVQLRMVMLPK